MRFSDALDRKVEEVERPPIPPIGTYLWRVAKIPELGEVSQGRYETVDIVMQCLQASEDVDPDALNEYVTKAGQLTGMFRRHRFMFDTEDAGKAATSEFHLRTFFEKHLNLSVDGLSWKEMFAESVNAQCLGSIRWRPDPKDAEIMYAEIDRTAPAA